MARTPARRFAGSRAHRQPTSWGRLVPTAFTVVPAASKVLLATFVLSNPGIGETVRRTRGIVSVRSDQTSLPEIQLGAVGFVIVSDLAIAAGAASIPGLVSDASDDGWFVWQPFGQSLSAAASFTTNWQWLFDSKAMRRIEEGFTIAVMAENAHATNGLSVHVSTSLLASLS